MVMMMTTMTTMAALSTWLALDCLFDLALCA